MPQVAVFSSSDETSDTLDSTSPEVYPSVQAFPAPPRRPPTGAGAGIDT